MLTEGNTINEYNVIKYETICILNPVKYKTMNNIR